MIIGTIAMLGPAIDRWPIPHTPLGAVCVQLALPLLVVGYDLWSRRRIDRSTGIAYAMIVAGLLDGVPHLPPRVLASSRLLDSPDLRSRSSAAYKAPSFGARFNTNARGSK